MGLSPALRELEGLESLWSRLGPEARFAAAARMARDLGIDKVVVNIDRNTAERRDVTVKLTPGHTAILYALAKAYPTVVSLDDLGTALWGGVVGRRRSKQTIRVMMHDLRKRVAPLAATIENQLGRGYRLELS